MSPQSSTENLTRHPDGGPRPPAVQRITVERRHHGDTVTDPYAWLADKENPETIACLEAQNAYTEALTAGQDGLQSDIFGEIKARTQESDLSVPARDGGYWYYSRTVEGGQYRVRCRRAVRPGEDRPPMTEDGGPLDGEEVILDANDLARGHDFFALGTYDVSPDGKRLAYSTDFEGSERFTLHVRDLVTGETVADEIPGVFYGSAWSADARALFYVTVDEAWRPNRVWRHLIGTPAASDVVVFEDADEKFWVGAGLTRSQRYLVFESRSKLTSEAWLLDAAEPTGELTLVAPRRPGVMYSVDHQAASGGAPERLLILHNDQAENFELAEASPADPAGWTPVIGHRADTRLNNFDAFGGFVVVEYRRDGLTGLRILTRDGGERELDFPEPIFTVSLGTNLEYETATFRLAYESMVTPDSVYDCEAATGELTLLRRRPVLPRPGGPDFDPAQYQQRREWATAPDGTRVPISLVWRAGVEPDGMLPTVLYGYGSYEISIDSTFSIPRLSLLDRGFVFAIAHIRGGGEMGRRWYDDGKMLRKVNTFTDFVACARHLVSAGYTRPDRIIARGGSAGGLLMGAVANLAPEAFAGIVAQVPFVDALTSILDPSLPLTVTEWEEWGDPLHDPEVYRYMKSYSPYENVVTGTPYPPILAVTSLNDTRVLFSEPAKWIARLQAEAEGGPFLLKTEMAAGHGGRSGRYDAWHEEAMVLAWMMTTAGVTD